MASDPDIPQPASDGLASGQFFIHAPPRGNKLTSLFGSFRANETESRIRALIRSCSSEDGRSLSGESVTSKNSAEALAAPAALTAGTVNGSPATYQLAGGAALVVRFGLCEVAGLGLHHLTPNVHYEPATRTVCVFSGHLQNLDELADRYNSDSFAEGPTSPSSILAARADPRQLAAETIMRMYQKEKGGDPLVLLSELQGQFSFVLYCSEKRQVFAARDSSGSEPLYYSIDDDGGVCLSNNTPHVPTDDGPVQWHEVPPGHYVSGRSPKLQQFALTYEQLSIRESYERSMDEDMSPRALALLVGRQEDDMERSLSMRRSLSPERAANDHLFGYVQ